MTHRFEHMADASPVIVRVYGAYGLCLDMTDGPRSGFSGGVQEAATRWYWLGLRIYAPMLRRFLSPDRLSPFDQGGWNRYAYCSDDPINRNDPTGHAWEDWLRVGLGMLGALVGVGAGFRTFAAGARAASKAASTGVTAGNIIAATARVVETVTVAAAIGSAVSFATENPDMGGILGWVALGAGTASAGVAFGQWSRSGSGQSSVGARAAAPDSPAWRSPAGQAGRKVAVPLLEGMVNWARSVLKGNPELRPMGPELPAFARFTAPHDPNTVLLASRVPVRQFDIGAPIIGLKKEFPNVRRLDVASGTHGTEDPDRNYTSISPNASRAYPELQFLVEDIGNVNALKSVIPDVRVQDVGGYTRRDMETMLSTPSPEKRILVLNWCYSDRDPVLGKYWQFHSYV